jgi:hypothetical protein
MNETPKRSKLDAGQMNLIRLVRKGQDGEGWAKVSQPVLPLMQSRIPAELVEIEGPFADGGGRARLTALGNNLLDLQGYF